MNPLTDEFLFKVIKEGGASVGKSPLMAPWGGSLSDAQIVDVVAYVRTLAVPPYKKPRAESTPSLGLAISRFASTLNMRCPPG